MVKYKAHILLKYKYIRSFCEIDDHRCSHLLI